jgi:hypothetical protein
VAGLDWGCSVVEVRWGHAYLGHMLHPGGWGPCGQGGGNGLLVVDSLGQGITLQTRGPNTLPAVMHRAMMLDTRHEHTRTRLAQGWVWAYFVGRQTAGVTSVIRNAHQSKPPS